jgi:hypothetical protein
MLVALAAISVMTSEPAAPASTAMADLSNILSVSGMQVTGHPLDFTPNFAAGVAAPSKLTEAGATFSLGDAKSYARDKLNSLGVQTQRPAGGAGKWYVFVAMSNQPTAAKPSWTVRSDAASMSAPAVTTPLLSDGKLGLGWSKGDMGASLGYVQRSIHALNGPVGVYSGRSESVAALSFTFRPH